MTGRKQIRLAGIVIILALVFAATRHNSHRSLGWRTFHHGNVAVVVPTITNTPSVHDAKASDAKASDAKASDAKGPDASTVVSVATDTAGDADDNDSDNDTPDHDDDDDSHGPAASHGPSQHDGDHAMRTVTIGRMLHAAHDTAGVMRVKVEYGVGELHIAPADAPWLYNVHLAYDRPDKSQGIRYDTASRTLMIGGGSQGDNIHIGKRNDSEDSDLRVGLARGVPMDMQVEFGAGDAVMQLGGLSLRNLTVSTGASDATVRFDTPNPVTLDRFKLEVGAAGFKAIGLGNAHARMVSVEAGAGDVDLDFSGQWSSDMTVDLTAALGAVHIHVPHGVVLEQTGGKVMIGSSEDRTGGISGAGGPQTPGGPLYHLRVHGTATLGSIDYDRQVANP
jgi:hypothetical protein